MKKFIRTTGLLIAAMGCAISSSQARGESTEPVFRPPLIKQVSAQQSVSAAKPPEADPPKQVPTSRWDAQEPIQTPEQPDVTTAIGAGSYSCGSMCYDPGCQFIVGVEATFFWPQLSRTFLNTGFSNGLGDVSYVNNSSLGSADGNLLVGPRITLGVQGECWGLVGRYWNAANSGQNFTPAIPESIQSGILLFDQFNAYTADLEVQRRFCWRNWDMFGFFGARYASVDNDRSLWTQNTFGTDELVQSQAFAGQQFNGAGITFGVFGLRPLFCDDGALQAYFTNRYSILWGNAVATTQTSAQASNSSGFFESTDGALAVGDGDLFIAEIGAGLQWETCLCCLPGRAFFRAGFEWQYWDGNGGVYATSESYADSGTNSSYAFTDTADLMFDLVGLTIGAGLTY